MKPGTRVLGVAESAGDDRSTVAGAVVTASRVVDGLAYGTATVGGRDATATVGTVYDRLDRADVRYLLVAGVAPAWFNLLDLRALHERVERPVLSVSFEESEGLEPALREHFEGDALADRLSIYRRLPERTPLTVNDEQLFYRAVGVDDEEAETVIHAVTPAGGRPEPVRVARLAARAAREYGDEGEATN